jgi:polyhydroxyalkanoate synthesis regulator phasin
MGETVDALGYKTDVKARTRDRVVGVKDRVVGTGGDVKDRIAGATPDTDDVKHQAKRAKSVAQNNPLGLAIGAVAVGFLAGMALPSTRIEDEKLGELSDEVIDRAKDTGQEALERGKQVAQEAAQSAKETAQESGQEHAQELKSTAQEHAQEAARS